MTSDGECFDFDCEHCPHGYKKYKKRLQQNNHNTDLIAHISQLEEEMEKIKVYISWNICPVCTNDCALCPLYSLLLEGEK